jgi:hypothetical protein
MKPMKAYEKPVVTTVTDAEIMEEIGAAQAVS